MANKHVKKYSKTLIIREIEKKATKNYYYILKIKEKIMLINADKGGEKLNHSHTDHRAIKW